MDHSDYTDDLVFARSYRSGPGSASSVRRRSNESEGAEDLAFSDPIRGGGSSSGSDDGEAYELRSYGGCSGASGFSTDDEYESFGIRAGCRTASADRGDERGEAASGCSDRNRSADADGEEERPKPSGFWDDDAVDDGDGAVDEAAEEAPPDRRSFWRRPPQPQSTANDGIDWGDDQIKTKEPEAPAWFSFRRRSSVSAGSEASAEDAELNHLLFPRRGTRQFVDARRTGVRSLDGKQSAAKTAAYNPRASAASRGSDRSGPRGSVANVGPGSGWATDGPEGRAEDVIARSSVNLGSVERALLADMVSGGHGNRWKNGAAARGSPPGRSAAPGGEAAARAPTPPRRGGGGSPSGDGAEGGRRGGRAVADPRDPPAPPGADGRAWDAEATLDLKNSASLSRACAVDDVSSIASSDHSGRIVPDGGGGSSDRGPFPKKNGRGSFISFGNWRSGKPTMLGAAKIQSGLRELDGGGAGYEEDEDDNLEEEVFAVTDAKHEKVVREAMGLMESVNKSVVSMGMEAPFRPIDEICPPFKKLHRNVLRQLDELNAVSPSDHDRMTARRTVRKKFRPKSSNGQFFTSSVLSDTSDETGTSEAPSLDDRKAVAAYIMNRIASSQDNSTKASGSKSHTAYLPNFMYYRFVAADPSSVIKPTSLCSGTGITGGDQYLQPDMLGVFGMFGSYFVGAGHLFREHEEEAADGPGRRTAFYMEPIREGESVRSAETPGRGSASSPGSADSSARWEDGEVDLAVPPDASLSIELLENIIEELKRGRAETRRGVPEMPEYVMEGATASANDAKPSPSDKNPGSPRRMENYEIRDRADKYY